jgi:ribosome-binding protein aMBF1 (putative translation factor)
LRDTQPLSKGGRDIASQTHVKVEGSDISVNNKASTFDLDGQTPSKYTDNLPK